MKKIASFTIDHIKLQPGIYVSRKDYLGEEVITTFDIRMTSPNEEPVMNTAELHAMEHSQLLFSVTMQNLDQRSSTGDRWAAVPATICFSQEIMSPKISYL